MAGSNLREAEKWLRSCVSQAVSHDNIVRVHGLAQEGLAVCELLGGITKPDQGRQALTGIFSSLPGPRDLMLATVITCFAPNAGLFGMLQDHLNPQPSLDGQNLLAMQIILCQAGDGALAHAQIEKAMNCFRIGAVLESMRDEAASANATVKAAMLLMTTGRSQEANTFVESIDYRHSNGALSLLLRMRLLGCAQDRSPLTDWQLVTRLLEAPDLEVAMLPYVVDLSLQQGLAPRAMSYVLIITAIKSQEHRQFQGGFDAVRMLHMARHLARLTSSEEQGEKISGSILTALLRQLLATCEERELRNAALCALAQLFAVSPELGAAITDEELGEFLDSCEWDCVNSVLFTLHSLKIADADRFKLFKRIAALLRSLSHNVTVPLPVWHETALGVLSTLLDDQANDLWDQIERWLCVLLLISMEAALDDGSPFARISQLIIDIRMHSAALPSNPLFMGDCEGHATRLWSIGMRCARANGQSHKNLAPSFFGHALAMADGAPNAADLTARFEHEYQELTELAITN